MEEEGQDEIAEAKLRLDQILSNKRRQAEPHRAEVEGGDLGQVELRELLERYGRRKAEGEVQDGASGE